MPVICLYRQMCLRLMPYYENQNSTLKRVIESDNSIVRILYDTDVFYKSKLFCNICEMTSVISA